MIENKILIDEWTNKSINTILAEANAEGWRAISFEKVKAQHGYFYVLMERTVPDKDPK